MRVVATATQGKAQVLWADMVRLGRLQDARIIQLAIIDSSPESAAQSSGKADALHEPFAQDYRRLSRSD